MAKKLTLEEWVERFDSVHKPLKRNYTYSNLVGNFVDVYCVDHDYKFKQDKFAHFKAASTSCPGCTLAVKRGRSFYESKLKKLHGDDYEFVDFPKKFYNKTKVDILCKKHDYIYKARLDSIHYIGCPYCNNKRSTNHKITKEEFIKRSKYKIVHCDWTNYNRDTKVVCYCEEHNHEFETSLGSLYRGKRACKYCELDDAKDRNSKPVSYWRKIFEDRLSASNYNPSDYEILFKEGRKYTYTDSVDVLCKKHNEVYTMYSVGSPSMPCRSCKLDNRSVGEKSMCSFIESVCDAEVIPAYRVGGYELDVYVPDKKIGFEFNGTYWHSVSVRGEDFHVRRFNALRDKGIRLVQFWDSDWRYSRSKVESVIRGIFGKFDRVLKSKYCEVKEISSSVFNKFVEDNYLGIPNVCSLFLGLFYNDELVSVMGFNVDSSDTAGFNRNVSTMEVSCNLLNTKVKYGADKLFKYFLNNHYKKGVIYANVDALVFEGTFLERLGFRRVKLTQPRPHYFRDAMRYKSVVGERYNICYDCGMWRFVYEK
jgi:hypothetical protein